ncbi:MAG: hypothetical protein ABI640_21195 [Gammaproteobacteria bacterium]
MRFSLALTRVASRRGRIYRKPGEFDVATARHAGSIGMGFYALERGVDCAQFGVVAGYLAEIDIRDRVDRGLLSTVEHVRGGRIDAVDPLFS